MQFHEIKDSNGTSLNSFAELLAEKARECGFISIVVLASKERKMIHAVSNADGSVPHLLIKIGRSMLDNEATESLQAGPLVSAPGTN